MNKNPIRLGLMAPLTGLVKLWGDEICHAGAIATQKINQNGGINGRPLRLIVGDDGSQPDTAVPCALDLVQKRKCDAIIGNLLSNSRIAVNHEVATPLGIPYLNFSFYEGSISGPFYFNFSALPNQQIDYMVPYMAERYGNKFFFAGSNYEWPRGSIDAAKKALERFGGTTVGEEYFDFGTTNFSELLEKVKKEGTEVFVPYFAGQDQVELLTQFEKAGLKDKVAVVMGHYDEVIASHLPPKVRSGLYSSNTYFMSLDNPRNAEYLSQLAQQPGVTGIWPRGSGILTNFGEGVYACVMAFAEAVRIAGTTEPEAVAKALKHIRIDSIQGRLVMDPKTQHASVNGYLARCRRDGSFEIVESFGEVAPIIPERYKEAFSLNLEAAEDSARMANSWQLLSCFKLDEKQRPLSCLCGKPESERVYDKLNKKQRQTLFTDGELVFDERQESSYPQLPVTSFERRYKITYYQDKGESFLTVSRSSLLGDDLQLMALESVDMSFIVTDIKGNIVMANAYTERLFGFRRHELVGHSVSKLIPPRFRHVHDKHINRFLSEHQKFRRMNERSDIVGYRKDGSEFPIKASIGRIEYPDEVLLIVGMSDITDQKRHEAELTWQATHDPLTHLPNKKLMVERIGYALEHSKISEEPVILLFLDLDCFKIINDSYGHTFGDKLLVEVSEILLNIVQPGQTVARFGGDEFLILIDKDTAVPGKVSNFVESVNRELRKPIVIDGVKLHTSVSIGVAIGGSFSHTAEELIRNADHAMYSVKDKGRDGWSRFDQNLYEEYETKRIVAGGLLDALDNNQLMMYYQPIVEVEEERIVAAEALCRWRLNNQMIPPSVFIPIAETTGQISRLGIWTFECVCRFIEQHRTLFAGGHLKYVSVNLSAFQLRDPHLSDKFFRLTESYGVEPHFIVLEVTETAVMTNIEGSIRILKELGDKGFRLAIDDFGTGYSSLGQLMRLPVNKLKIDKIFIDHVAENAQSQLMVRTIETLAHGLEMKIVAEGVETSDQFEVLSDFGIDYIQGYLFYQPLPEDDFVQLIY